MSIQVDSSNPAHALLVVNGLAIMKINQDGSVELPNAPVSTSGSRLLTANQTPFTKEYVSPQQTITAGAQLTLAHGLASKPKLVTGAFVCVTAEHGYSVGDEAIDPLGLAYTDAGAIVTNTASTDSTSIYVRFSIAAGFIRILNKSTGALANITPANWRYLVRAYA